jgi:hypothetical protein
LKCRVISFRIEGVITGSLVIVIIVEVRNCFIFGSNSGGRVSLLTMVRSTKVASGFSGLLVDSEETRVEGVEGEEGGLGY